MSKSSVEQGRQRLLHLARLTAVPPGEDTKRGARPGRPSKSDAKAIQELRDLAVRSLHTPHSRRIQP